MNGSNEKQMTVPAAAEQLNHHADDEIGKSLHQEPLEPSLEALIGTFIRIFYKKFCHFSKVENEVWKVFDSIFPE